MRICIDTEVLEKHGLTMCEFLVMLLGYYDIDYREVLKGVLGRNLAESNAFKPENPILSDNNKDLVARILIESDEKARNSRIDFEDLAAKLIAEYPKGLKPGTTHLWAGTVEEIAQKLRTLVVVHGFVFSEKEAIEAVKELVKYHNGHKTLPLLRNFILFTKKEPDGNVTIDSGFMSLIENSL